MKKIDKHVVITGIICLALIEVIALLKNVDGVLMTTIIGLIACAIGITIPGDKILKK